MSIQAGIGLNHRLNPAGVPVLVILLYHEDNEQRQNRKTAIHLPRDLLIRISTLRVLKCAMQNPCHEI